ncbi:MAG: hypothetical protein HYY02_02720 [Chloroflexi bacterium]|nr:hypothetical protein [Chloroflexota bacterium]
MLQQLKRLFTGGKPERRPLELTVADQWTLKLLFLAGDRFLSQQRVVEGVLAERPTLIPHEVAAALLKLHLAGALERSEAGYRVAPGARKLKGILPENPSVNLDYYG